MVLGYAQVLAYGEGALLPLVLHPPSEMSEGHSLVFFFIYVSGYALVYWGASPPRPPGGCTPVRTPQDYVLHPLRGYAPFGGYTPCGIQDVVLRRTYWATPCDQWGPKGV